MRDFARGAFEALCWVKWLLERFSIEEVRREVEEAIREIQRGVAVDFTARLSSSV